MIKLTKEYFVIQPYSFPPMTISVSLAVFGLVDARKADAYASMGSA